MKCTINYYTLNETWSTTLVHNILFTVNCWSILLLHWLRRTLLYETGQMLLTKICGWIIRAKTYARALCPKTYCINLVEKWRIFIHMFRTCMDQRNCLGALLKLPLRFHLVLFILWAVATKYKFYAYSWCVFFIFSYPFFLLSFPQSWGNLHFLFS